MMTRNKHLLTILIFGLFLSNQSLANHKDRYIINPVVTSFDSFPSLLSNTRYFVSFEDSENQQDTTPSGFTRTGIKSQAPIYCSPSITIAIKKSLESLFIKNKILTNDPTTATYIIKVKLLNFSIKESSFTFYQTMDSHCKFEIIFIDPFSADKKHSFIVESSNSETALDTSNHAESIVRGVVRNALLEIVKSLNKQS